MIYKVLKERHFFLLMIALGSFVLPVSAQNKIGNNPTVIQDGSLLELESMTKGLRISRIVLDDINSWSPLDGSPVSGMLVFNEKGEAPKGLYYWDIVSSRWVRVVNTAELTSLIAGSTQVSNTITGNSLVTTVNGVTSLGEDIIKNNNLSVVNGILISTINGVASSPGIPLLVSADNGLTHINGNVQLGGLLTKPTTIETSQTNTLSVTGLQTGDAKADNLLVVAPGTGLLREISASALSREKLSAGTGLTGLDFDGSAAKTWSVDDTKIPYLPSGFSSGYLKYNGTNWLFDTSSYITSINGLANTNQTISTGTSGTDFNVQSSGSTHTFNLPDASSGQRGALTSTDWKTFNDKVGSVSAGSSKVVIGGTSTAPTVDVNTSDLGTVTLQTGVTGTDVNVGGLPANLGGTLTLNIPLASASNTGKLSNTDWTTFNDKIGSVTASTPAAVSTSGTTATILNTDAYWNANQINSGSVPVSASYIATNAAGQLVGATTPVTTITGTTDQVIASSSTGDVTLSLPQSIATTSSPTFSGLTVSGLNSKGLVTNNSTGVLSTTTGTGFVTINGSGDVVYDNSNYLKNNESITFTASGDITGTASGITSLSPALTIGSNAVTYSKLQQVAASSLVGNATGSSANAQNITLGTGLSFSGSNLETFNIPNSSLINSKVTVNGTDIALGSSGTITAVSPNKLSAGTGLTGSDFDGSAARTWSVDDTKIPYLPSGFSSGYLKYNGTNWLFDTSSYITSINGLTNANQTISTGTNGTDFNVQSLGSTHTFNLPDASSSQRGALTSTDWTTFNDKIGSVTASTPGAVSTSGTTATIQNTAAYWNANQINSGSVPLSMSYIATNATGQLVGATTPVTTITGTTDQVIASSSTGDVTLSLPQSIATTSSPTFSGLTVSGLNAKGLVSNSSTGVLSTTTGTGFVTINGSGDVVYDNSAYLKNNESITFAASGDITGSTSGTTSLSPALTIGSNAVTYSKLQQVAASSLVGNATGSSADAQNITLGTGLGFSGSSLETSNIPNSSLVNSKVTVNGTDIALGSSGTITAVSPNKLSAGTGLTGSDFDGSAARTWTVDDTKVPYLPSGFSSGYLKYNGTNWLFDTSSYITSINGLTNASQTISTGTSGTDFNVQSSGSTHTFNLPDASSSQRGALISTDWKTFNDKIGSVTGSTPAAVSTSGTTATILNTGAYWNANQINSGSVPASASYIATNTNGQLVGATTPVTTITGTTDQVIASSSTGDVTLSLPQSIASTSSPTFSGLTVSGLNSKGLVTNSSAGVLSTTTGTGFVTINGSGDVVYDNSAYLKNNESITFTASGDITGTASGTTALSPALTIGSNAVTYSKLQQVAGSSLIGNATGSLANAQNITLGTGLSFSGSSIETSNIPNSSLVNSKVTVNGTDIALGSSGTITAVSPNKLSAGTGLTGSDFDGSAAQTWTVTPATNSTLGGVIVGTGLSAASGTISVNTSQNITNLSNLTAGIVHSNASGNLSSSSVNLASGDVTGILPVANGGTGVNSLTGNGILYGNGIGAVQATSAGTNGYVLISTGTAAPAWKDPTTLPNIYTANGTLTANRTVTQANYALDFTNSKTSGSAFDVTGTGAYTGTGLFNVTANSATTGTLANISSSSLTEGTGLSITSSSSSLNSTNGLLYVANASASTDGTVGRIQSNSTSGSGLTVMANGKVGIGTSAPVATLHNTGSTVLGFNVVNNSDPTFIPGNSDPVDNYSGLVIVQDTYDVAITLPAPTDKTPGRLFTIANSGTSTNYVSVKSCTLPIGMSVTLVWDGNQWTESLASPITIVNGSNLFSTGLPGTGSGVTGSLSSNFFGEKAGQNATGASYSNFLGNGAGADATSASSSNFLGQNAGLGAISASFSNFIGEGAGYYANLARNSNFIGQNAGYNASSAQYSTLIGYNVGNDGLSGNHIGKNNIIIGTNITLPATTENSINIGGVLFGKNTYSSASGNPSTAASNNGSIGIGVASPAARLHLPAGGAASGMAPLKFTTSANKVAVLEEGAMEYANSHLYFTTATERLQLDYPIASAMPLNGLTDAKANNSINNGNFTQTWNWNAATSGNLFSLANSNAAHTGSLFSLSSSTTTGTVQSIAGNSLSSGNLLSVSSSSSALNSSTKGLLYVANTGLSTSGLLARFAANTNPGSGLTIKTDGNVGIGTDNPQSALDIKGDMQLINASSESVRLQAPASLSSYTLILPENQGQSGQLLVNDGTGALSWASGLTNGLAAGRMFVGNASGIATAVLMDGDATLDNNGILTLKDVNPNSGSYGSVAAIPQFTVDATGRITAAASVSTAGIPVGGDVSGTVSAVTVNKLKGNSLLFSSLTDGDLLKYTSSGWVNWTPNYIARTALSATTPLTYNNATGVFAISQATNSTNGYLSSNDWTTFNNKQNAIALTTTGTGGAATFSGGTLNIPNYTYTLPTATASVKGGVTVGAGLQMTGDVISTVNNGTVTTVSSGNLTPLFSTSVANAGSTPTISYTLTNAGANTLFGNNTGSSAAPSYFQSSALPVGGDISGTLGATNVDKLKGTAISITSLSANNILKYDGSNWVNWTPNFLTLSALSATAPITYDSGTGAIGITQATNSTDGYLSSGNWTTFNNKVTSVGAGSTKVTIGGTTTEPTIDVNTANLGSITLATGTTGVDVNVSGSPASLGGTLTLNIPDAGTSARGVVNTGAQTFAGAKTFNSAITAPTSGNTMNGLIVNSGALSGITGYAQASGNFAISGSGTFSTGTGNISLNGNTTLAAGKTLAFTDASNSYSTSFTAGSQSANISYTLPTAGPTVNGQVLSGTTAGALSWTTPTTYVNVIGTIDSQTKAANGAVISGNSLYMQTADASSAGLVSATTQTFAGAKTFSSTVTSTGFVKSGGTSAQFLKADGSVDAATYLTTAAAAGAYLPLSGGTLTGALSGTTATFSGIVKSGTGAGFQSAGYVANAANNIWCFASATPYGMSYYQGTALVGVGDAIGFHFGNQAAPVFYVNATGNAVVSGSITAGGNVTAYSDIRLKKNIQTLPNVSESLRKINAVEFDRKDIKIHQLGFIAQNVQQYFPDLVTIAKDSMSTLSLNYQAMTAPLLKGWQEHDAVIISQQAEIEAQHQEIDLLKKEIEFLKINQEELKKLITNKK
ncbi:hypothetical protein Palpr_1089 [Paludibacter propionicigenes WB4]|uniref:Peptidase S74 domain-containing protein n=1 Tax=Paludibacter propionicigenes (strain DSM 17365 / JCM 13257 / WB4) TaxID=694427 RepID=E4T3E3_PALPW|nr:tail fiber domain-containing protein [Paludibacter propionicigenes]ADQ79237.1 hypothetical protein Palpr_1089 [Paludibacter propionicigenes WB4]